MKELKVKPHQPTFMKRTVNALAVLIFLLAANAAAKAQVSDAGLWASLTVEKKLTQRLSVGITGELRFNENISELSTIFTDLGLGYNFFKDELLGVSVNYRYIRRKNVEDFYMGRHRWYTDVVLKKKFGKLVPSWRIRFQSQFRDPETSDAAWNAEYYLRNRLQLKLDMEKKYRPYIGAELYTQADGFEFMSDNIRLTAGVDYSFNERSILGLGYLIDREFNVNDPARNYNIVIEYKLTL